ncbi:MAG: OsmC family protein [Variovorax sp.]|nr:OsmC family protein [Variovorax sp.]
MSHLNEYLAEKRAAVEAGTAQPANLKAHVRAEGRSGVRRLRIEHQVISDSPPDFAGHNLGPSSPELQLGALGTCVTHIFLIHAAERKVPLESLKVGVTGIVDPRAGKPGHEQTPIWPHAIGYTVHTTS